MTIQLLDVKQVADLIGMSRGFVRRQITLGHLPATRLGRYVRVDRRAVVAYLDVRTEGGWSWAPESTLPNASGGRGRRRIAAAASASAARWCAYDPHPDGHAL